MKPFNTKNLSNQGNQLNKNAGYYLTAAYNEPSFAYLHKMYNKQPKKFLIALLGPIALMIISAGTHKPAKVIQINVNDVLNARSVTTLNKGKLTTWTTGIDKDNGYLTMAAASFMGNDDPHALPDNSLFPANESHPEILLHYSNEATTKNQTRCIPDSGEFVFKVPDHKYSDLYVSVTSSYGTSSLRFELTYADGVESKNFILPDWFKDIPENDPDFSYVAHNMGKWGDKNNLKEKDHHNIDAINIHPNPDRVLKNVKVKKLPGGYLVFWAATGVVKN